MQRQCLHKQRAEKEDEEGVKILLSRRKSSEMTSIIYEAKEKEQKEQQYKGEGGTSFC